MNTPDIIKFIFKPAFLCLAFSLCAAFEVFPQQKVSAPKGKAIMVDGKFSAGEWEDARTISVSEGIKLYFKQSGDYVFIGIQAPVGAYKSAWTDLYVSGNNGELLNLHASRKLGERKFINGEWEEWGKWWTNEGSWRANYNRPDDQIIEGRMRTVQLMDEGWEFQIKKSKFKEDEIKILFEISLMNDEVKTMLFPKNCVTNGPKGWLILKI